MVATIHSLPLELPLLVISNACPQIPAGDEFLRACDRGERYDLLRAEALMCPAWTGISQELLWEEVHLQSSESRNAFAGAPRYPSRHVVIVYQSAEEEEEAPLQTVLERLSGVETLCIVDESDGKPDECNTTTMRLVRVRTGGSEWEREGVNGSPLMSKSSRRESTSILILLLLVSSLLSMASFSLSFVATKESSTGGVFTVYN